MNEIDKNVTDALDKAKATLGTDAKIAQRLGVAASAVSKWRTGEKVPSDRQAIGLAHIINEQPEKIMLLFQAARQEDKTEKRYWTRIAEQYIKNALPCLIVVICLIINNLTGSYPEGCPVIGIMLTTKIRRRVWKLLFSG